MLDKRTLKYVHSLELRKFRSEYRTFLAEGSKLVGDIIGVFSCRYLFATSDWLAEHAEIHAERIMEVSKEELRRLSLLKTPKDVVAVFYLPDYAITEIDAAAQLVLAVDGIQDPGNLGAMVRLADWFGIEHLVCSLDTVDIFNPKAVQATMGALARVQVHYASLPDWLSQLPPTPVFGTFLNGENIYQSSLSSFGV
ncbi:MAG: RNA methyltransferase, partial [Bacteroidales bacterium]|nr:RNA methyltransferase [Bacteroidales bacterium]